RTRRSLHRREGHPMRDGGEGPVHSPRMSASLKIGRVFGIQIGIHFSWLIIAFLVTYSLAVVQFPETYPGWTSEQYWIVGVATAVLFFVSVLVHEVSHALMAQRFGVRVRDITLFMFGGAAHIESEAKRPRDEALIAAVGPLSSLVLGGLLMLASGAIAQPQISALVAWLGGINIALALFNLIPGFPMDGGRILRAVLWAIRGDSFKATRTASFVGRSFGYLLIAFGVITALEGSGGLFGGLWLALIGWFLSNAAESTVAQMTLERSLRGVRVREVMDDTPPAVGPNTTVAELVHEHLLRGDGRSFLVTQDENILAGVVTLTDVQRVPRDAWESTRVTDIMTRFTELATVRPDDPLEKALKVLQEREVGQLPVVQQGREAIGLLTRSGILRLIDTRLKLGI
ncbi:MAG: M50 family metallopeptidase, partial [Candidatus Limnocylindria bacterium]